MPCTIRKAGPEEAEALIPHVREITSEPDNNEILEPDEFTPTVEEERAFLDRTATAHNSIFLVAEQAGRIVGSLMLTGGNRRATRHVATLGMSVKRPWRNQGIGSALLAQAIAWARATGIVRRIQLFVFARNAPAIHLYEKFGFRVEGRRQRAVWKQGVDLDDLLMALLL